MHSSLSFLDAIDYAAHDIRLHQFSIAVRSRARSSSSKVLMFPTRAPVELRTFGSRKSREADIELYRFFMSLRSACLPSATSRPSLSGVGPKMLIGLEGALTGSDRFCAQGDAILNASNR
jgi:hypothetical protein